MKRKDFEKQQLQQLKDMAEIFLKPMGKLCFPVVVEAMTGCKVIPYIEEDDNELLSKLSDACKATVAYSENNPVPANRPNDVSSPVEGILQANLQSLEIQADKPRAKNTQAKGPQGYPDLLISHANRPTYIEVKVSRVPNIAKGSARNFFYQPVKNSKITVDARHFLCGFSIEEASEKQWVLREWTITDLWFLRVKLKPEYNANNLEIYRDEAVLMKGDGKRVKFSVQ